MLLWAKCWWLLYWYFLFMNCFRAVGYYQQVCFDEDNKWPQLPLPPKGRQSCIFAGNWIQRTTVHFVKQYLCFVHILFLLLRGGGSSASKLGKEWKQNCYFNPSANVCTTFHHSTLCWLCLFCQSAVPYDGFTRLSSTSCIPNPTHPSPLVLKFSAPEQVRELDLLCKAQHLHTFLSFQQLREWTLPLLLLPLSSLWLQNGTTIISLGCTPKSTSLLL